MENEEAADFAEDELRRAIAAQERSAEEPPQIVPPRAPLVPEAPQRAIATINADRHGALRATNVDELWRLAKMTYEGGMLPQTLDTPAKVMVALQYLAEIGLPGISGLRNVMVVNGLPTLWGDLPLTLVRKSGKLGKFREWIFDENGLEICPTNKNLKSEIAGAACFAQRLTVQPDGSITVEEKEAWFTVADARLAGLWGGRVWKVYPRRMLQMRPRSQILKDLFGDVLLGGALLEYDHNMLADTDMRGEHSSIGEVPAIGSRVVDEINAIGAK
jgi:hypothetical protein